MCTCTCAGTGRDSCDAVDIVYDKGCSVMDKLFYTGYMCSVHVHVHVHIRERKFREGKRANHNP